MLSILNRVAKPTQEKLLRDIAESGMTDSLNIKYKLGYFRDMEYVKSDVTFHRILDYGLIIGGCDVKKVFFMLVHLYSTIFLWTEPGWPV